MRILVENSGYGLSNHGDLAMLQVGTARIRTLLPGAELEVLTSAPDRLAVLVPGSRPLSLEGRRLFLEDRNLFGGLHRLFPGAAQAGLQRLESGLRTTWPHAAAVWAARRMSRRGVDPRPLHEFLAAVSGCRALVATGGGFLTDAFAHHAVTVLELFRLARALGKPFFLFGQGIGPLTSPKLLQLARSVLPAAGLIALREGRQSEALLRSLGVPADRIRVTGDDAIEMAWRLRTDIPGNAVGFNVRVADYSQVGPHLVRSCYDTVSDFAHARGATVLPTPIACGHRDSDVDQLVRTLSLDPAGVDALSSLTSPESVIRQIGKCRLVVTGSYHAGVFAMAQGIPLVGLYRSSYYSDKFQGLAHQFGRGCIALSFDDPDFENALQRAMTRLWDEAADLREPLLQAAEAQIAASQEAFRQFATLLSQDA
jgi:colanic acid/amylovoran biosynthesis protein